MEPLAPHIEKMLIGNFSRQPLMVAYGATITAMTRGFVEIAVDPKEILLRGGGLFHGGVVTALADSAGGYAAATFLEAPGSFLTVELKINFLNPAKGTRLITRGKVLKSGKTLTVVQTDSFIENEAAHIHVATALITFIREKTT